MSMISFFQAPWYLHSMCAFSPTNHQALTQQGLRLDDKRLKETMAAFADVEARQSTEDAHRRGRVDREEFKE